MLRRIALQTPLVMVDSLLHVSLLHESHTEHDVGRGKVGVER